MATDETKLSLKLLIDTKAKKVLFAEVEKDFVDFLFHILTLPVGVVTKLLTEKGMKGCLHNIYESVENMSDTYIQSKDMILTPECPYRISLVPLQLLNDVPTQRVVYNCTDKCAYATDDPSAKCSNCRWQAMTRMMRYVAPPIEKGVYPAKGGFVQNVMRYMVMDDLVVKPVSAISTITGLNKYFNVMSVDLLQEEMVEFGKEEALKLLKSSFESKAVLTSVFMSSVRLKTELVCQ
ncbi:hypothetical protein P3S68_013441 [Capsicum galapagoense]